MSDIIKIKPFPVFETADTVAAKVQPHAMCARCKRPVSHVGCIETDDFLGWEFNIICHGDRREFTMSIADLEGAEIRTAWFFDEKTLPHPGLSEAYLEHLKTEERLGYEKFKREVLGEWVTPDPGPPPHIAGERKKRDT